MPLKCHTRTQDGVVAPEVNERWASWPCSHIWNCLQKVSLHASPSSQPKRYFLLAREWAYLKALNTSGVPSLPAFFMTLRPRKASARSKDGKVEECTFEEWLEGRQLAGDSAGFSMHVWIVTAEAFGAPLCQWFSMCCCIQVVQAPNSSCAHELALCSRYLSASVKKASQLFSLLSSVAP